MYISKYSNIYIYLLLNSLFIWHILHTTSGLFHRVKPCPSSRVAVKRSGPSPAIAQNKKKYKGTYNKTPGRWMSQICYEGKFLRLGTFSSDSDAAVAFDNACLYLRGRDAELNFKLSNYLNAKGEIVLDPSLLKLINSGLERHGLKR